MFKTSDQRLRQGLDAIRLHVGAAEADYIDEELSRGMRLRFAPLLDMGGYEGTFRNSNEKTQRNAVRGLLLAGLVLGAIDDASVTPALKAELSSQGKTGYNEVVVVGTSPEGKAIDVIGIYLKVHPNGNLYVDPTAKAPAVSAELLKLIQVQQQKGMPVVRIVDASSGASTTPVGF